MLRWIALALVLAACGSSDEVPDAAMPDLVCAVCPSCNPGEKCLMWRGDQMPACAKTCVTAADCGGGLRCTQLDQRSDWLCLSSSLPAFCAPGAHTTDCSAPSSSCDGNTLLVGFFEALNATCGVYRKDCPNGCGANGDGGFACK
jgi:hypothetical protein